MAEQITNYDENNFLTMKKNFIVSNIDKMIEVEDDGDNIRVKMNCQSDNEEDEIY